MSELKGNIMGKLLQFKSESKGIKRTTESNKLFELDRKIKSESETEKRVNRIEKSIESISVVMSEAFGESESNNHSNNLINSQLGEYRFYCTDWAPNGCNDLIITDIDGQLIEYLEGFLFGVNLMKNPALICCFDGESVFGTGKDIGDLEGIDSNDLVRSIDSDDILQYMTISPINTEVDQLKKIKPYIAA